MKNCLSKTFIDLTIEETKQINGGGPVFRWLGQIAGHLKNAVESVVNTLANAGEAYCSTPEGAAVQQALSDFH